MFSWQTMLVWNVNTTDYSIDFPRLLISLAPWAVCPVKRQVQWDSIIEINATIFKILVAETLVNIQGVPKKRTNRLLLEPRCTSSITSRRYPLVLEKFFCSFLTKTMQDQALLRHVNGKIRPQSDQFWAQLRASQDTSRGGTYLTKINFSKFYPQFLMVLYVS